MVNKLLVSYHILADSIRAEQINWSIYLHAAPTGINVLAILQEQEKGDKAVLSNAEQRNG